MTLKKSLTIIAAAGALAAVSVPAMAFENEFHGSYTFNSIFSNYQDGFSGDRSAAVVAKNAQMNNYFEQRGRIQYIAKASDDLKLVTHFEMDTRFGSVTNSKYTNSSDAGGLDTDGINLETKHLYLDANLGSNFNLKTGLMPYKDTLKGIFIDADIPAIYTTTKLNNYTLGVGFSRFSESEVTYIPAGRLGDKAKDLFILDNTFAFTKDTKASFSYYFLADYQTAVQPLLLHTLGVSGETKVGPATVSGFLAMQTGNKHLGSGVHTQFHGWAANAAAKVAAGPGTAKAAVLFTTGDNNARTESNHAWIGSSVDTYNEGGMMILARNTANSPTSTDRYIRRNISNLALLTAGYDANLTKQVYLNGNVGFAWTPASGETANACDFMGTELNLESGYKLNDNLTLRAQAAYAILGGLYKDSSTFAKTVGKTPDNPYTMRLLASFKF